MNNERCRGRRRLLQWNQGVGRRRGTVRVCDQSRRRSSAYGAPVLGNLGDELAYNIARSVLIAECSDFTGSC